MSLRVAIVGLGRMARHHATVLRDLDGVEIVAGANPDPPARREEFCNEFGVPAHYRNASELLESEQIDAAIVAVSPLQNVSVTRTVLEAGVPTLAEKPVGFSVAEAESLAELAARRGVLTAVGVNRRYYSNITRAMAAIDAAGGLRSVVVEAPERIWRENRFGHPKELVDRWFWMNGVHCVDLMRHVGGAITAVSARTAGADGRTESYHALVEFDSGAIGQYVSNWLSPGSWSLTLYADGLRCEINPLERTVLIGNSQPPVELPAEQVDIDYKPGVYRQDRAFVEAVREGRPLAPPGCDLADAVETVRLIDAFAAGAGAPLRPGRRESAASSTR